MKKYLKIAFVFLSFLSIAACAGNSSLVSYKNQTPKIDIRSYFNGEIESWGFIEDGDGKVIKRFTSKVSGKWSANKGIIQEDFVFNNGDKDSRTWMVSVDDKSDNFTAIAHDIIGTAKGSSYGNTMSTEYVLTILDGKNKSNVNAKNLLYLIDDKLAISIVSLERLGFSKGKIITSYKKISNLGSKVPLESDQPSVKNPVSLTPVVSEENKNKSDNK